MTTEELIKEFQGRIEFLNKLNKSQTPSRDDILESIADDLRSVRLYAEQVKNGDNTYSSWQTLEHSCRAEALIELLEVHDCGSMGGFDRDVGSPYGIRSLEGRYKAVLRKYLNENV